MQAFWNRFAPSLPFQGIGVNRIIFAVDLSTNALAGVVSTYPPPLKGIGVNLVIHIQTPPAHGLGQTPQAEATSPFREG